MDILNKIKNSILKSKKIVIFHHVIPDGDSISCSYGLLKALQKKFPNKIIKWVCDKNFIEKNFSYLNIDFEDVFDSEIIDHDCLAIIGDTSISKRIFKYEIFEKFHNKIIFDHHQNNSDIKANLIWKDSSLPASAIQAFWIINYLNVEWDEKLALLIVFGILTDTGRFSFSLANSLPLQITSKLFKYISDEKLDAVYQKMFQKTKNDIAFEAWALNNIIYEDNVCSLIIDHKIQKQFNLTPNSAKKNWLIANIKNYSIWVLFIENKNNFKVSIRSNKFAINKIAENFNGGGHKKAASCFIDNLKEKEKIIYDLNAIFKKDQKNEKAS